MAMASQSSAEFHQLQREYRHMELNRKSYADVLASMYAFGGAVMQGAVLALAKLIYKGCDGFLMEASVFWSTRLPRCIGLRRAVWVWRRIDGS